MTMGYDELGQIRKFGVSGSVSVDAREFATASDTVRGLVVTIVEGQYRDERAFIDMDEIADLVAGIDVLLGIKQNPTGFKNFERRYQTRGELRVTAYSSDVGIRFAIRAGRVLTASVLTLTDGDLQKFRSMIVAGQEKLSTHVKAP